MFWIKSYNGITRLRIFSVVIILSVLTLLSSSSHGQSPLFDNASCVIIYSLKGSENKSFNDQISQLSRQIDRKNIHFIDLNNWRKTQPHIDISGRSRNQLRQQHQLTKGINQTIVLNSRSQIVGRYFGSVTLVNVLLDCH
ncbi:hypothetical protein [uncultured Paraglaciecola sp.]|uniref:hypothetical protein n=1 Tax=uncultured Paraglaciecola sp. TaxID=1765024 RepID=UPI00260A51CB|nr:hypothetical protein [uncultured Paraglaciecola sp.]